MLLFSITPTIVREKEFLFFLRQVLCTRYQELPIIAFGSMISLEELLGMFDSLSFQTLNMFWY